MCFSLDLVKTFCILHQKQSSGLGTSGGRTGFKAVSNCVTRDECHLMWKSVTEKWIMTVHSAFYRVCKLTQDVDCYYLMGSSPLMLIKYAHLKQEIRGASTEEMYIWLLYVCSGKHLGNSSTLNYHLYPRHCNKEMIHEKIEKMVMQVSIEWPLLELYTIIVLHSTKISGSWQNWNHV